MEMGLFFEPFSSVLCDVTREGKKLQTSQYLKEGLYPIIDQGKNKIAGYTNKGEYAFFDLPVIIFGDHTRIFKFIDFPFLLGADGVKIIKCISKNYYLKYIYYYLLSIQIPNNGYNRHFKWLKEIKIPRIPLAKQLKIIDILDRATELIALRKQQIQKLDLLVKSQFIEMFSDIIETVPLSYYIKYLSAGKSIVGEIECQNKVLKTGSVSYDFFDASQIKNLPIEYEPHPDHLVKKGDIIISRMNTIELVGASAYVWDNPVNLFIPDRLWKAELYDNCCPIFIWQMLIQSTVKEKIRKIASGTSGSMKNISKQAFLSIHVKKVDINQQKQFALLVEEANKLKYTLQQSLEKLELNYKALMQTYFG